MLTVVRSVLRGPAAQDLDDAGVTTLQTDRFGSKVMLTLSGSPLLSSDRQVRGAVLTMEHRDVPTSGVT